MTLIGKIYLLKNHHCQRTTFRIQSRLAEDRIEEQLTDGRNEKVTSDVAMFMYDHANGKATQRIEQRTEAITLNIDLTGTGTPVLDQ